MEFFESINGERKPMPAPVRTPKSRWIEEGLRMLGVGGPHAVKIEALAEALGVTKGGFYWHFDDRDALLSEMLDTWEHVVTDDVIRRVEGGGGGAPEKLRRLFAIAVSVDEMVELELAIREWGRHDEDVAARLRRLDNRRMDYMRSLFAQLTADCDDVEVRCLLSLAIFVANPYIHADNAARSRRALLRLVVDRVLVGTPA